ncbi:MAG: phospho-N-acetylmuramoyl-pentapeptide-transferase, partial [Alphaproteobacteria bacterium]|nr:phospho-N-acetylmuramoyl-pentapeptide-transferase [Alphaproteobacteria bacterium]
MWSMWSYEPETALNRAVYAFFTALIISLLTGSKLIAFLRGHEKGGQPIRDDGPQSHIEEKKGTPTMGGLLILGTALFAMLLFSNVTYHFVWISILVILIFGATGFVDDYVKIKKHTPNAMTAKMKLFIQFMAAVLAVNVISAATPNAVDSKLFIPYIGCSFQLSWLYFLFALLVISGSSNAVNLSDGLDGL